MKHEDKLWVSILLEESELKEMSNRQLRKWLPEAGFPKNVIEEFISRREEPQFWDWRLFLKILLSVGVAYAAVRSLVGLWP
jgi:hypothetical protein